MNALLDLAGIILLENRFPSCNSFEYRSGTTADGHVPDGGVCIDHGGLSRANTLNLERQQQSRHQGSDSTAADSFGTILFKVGVQIAAVGIVGYMSLRMSEKLQRMNERQTQQEETQQQQSVRSVLRAKLPARDDIDMDALQLNAHEISVAMDVVASSSLVTTFDMIGGLGEMRDEIMDIVTLACSKEAQLQGVVAPRGMLLSGVPGTGKTMLAQAIAKESGATFINVRMGAVQQKYVGEGEKMVAAIFSLANKLAPSIIFIDEIDCCLRNRTGFERDHDLRVKTEFMTLWDGLLTERSRPVMVLGTTNRPADVDPAILRRLPRQFEVGLPVTRDQRLHILQLIARKYTLGAGVNLMWVAAQTPGFSGSDLDALFQAAQTVPAREFARVLREEAEEAREQARVAEEERARIAEAERPAAAAEDEGATAPPSSSPASTGTGRSGGEWVLGSWDGRIRGMVGTLESWRERLNAAIEEANAAAAGRRPEASVEATAAATAAMVAAAVRGAEMARTSTRMRGITQEDFVAALENVRPTGQVAAAFAVARAMERARHEQ